MRRLRSFTGLLGSFEEYIDKTPDAIKVLLYAAAMRGITYRKYGALENLQRQSSQH